MSEILPKLDFGHFHREVCGHSHLNVPRIQKRFCFVPEPCLVGQWRSQTQIFLGEMYDFRRTATALFCLEKSLSKHKMTTVYVLDQWFPTGEEFLPREEFHVFTGGMSTL